jgi:hypothetical protein
MITAKVKRMPLKKKSALQKAFRTKVKAELDAKNLCKWENSSQYRKSMTRHFARRGSFQDDID